MSPLLHDINQLIRSSLDDVTTNPEYSNRLQALDAYSQQMEDYLHVLEEMTRTLGQGVRQLRNKQRQFALMAAETDDSIYQFRSEGQPALARSARSHKRVMQQASEAFRQEADAQHERFRALMDVKLRLEARLTEVAQMRTALQMTQMTDQRTLLPI